MIELSLNILEIHRDEDFVISVTADKDDLHSNNSGTLSDDKTTVSIEGNFVIGLSKPILDLSPYEIWIVFPKSKKITRFFRSGSNSNTILLTEQCDQRCIMCSQPPKNYDYTHFELYKEAIALIEGPSVIGISGGEPTLFKTDLLDFISDIVKLKPDIKFHVLTNGQHFSDEDISTLKVLRKSIIWAVPIYSSDASEHDKIVGKKGAFDELLKGLNVLAKSSSKVELRTVVLRENIFGISLLANFIGINLPWVQSWSIMQLEKKGYAVFEWEKKFYDTSDDFKILSRAIEISQARGFAVDLYNFPLCTVPSQFRKYCRKSISDWKSKYIKACMPCADKKLCSGMFEWYDEASGFKNIKALK